LSFLNVFLVIATITLGTSAVDQQQPAAAAAAVDQRTNGAVEERIRTLEDELQRVKDHLNEVDNLLDAWFLSAEQPQQRPSSMPNEIDPTKNFGWRDEKRGGNWAFMGSRGKRKQPFILGSRGKRSVPDQDEPEEGDDDRMLDKRAQYFYGSRGKKQFANSNQGGSSVDENAFHMPPFNNKRYTFMGSRGKK